jgi:hypothetical protein
MVLSTESHLASLPVKHSPSTGWVVVVVAHALQPSRGLKREMRDKEPMTDADTLGVWLERLRWDLPAMKFGTAEPCASMFEAVDEMAPATRPGARS